MSYLDWKVGDKVVCVFGPEADEPPPHPVVNQIYTLSAIWVDFEGDVFVDLVEMPSRESIVTPEGCWEPGFLAWTFRKVQPRKTDIAIFEAMLHPSKQREPV